MGDLERAERELIEAVDLHRDVDAPAGEAHSLQRLAEVRLEQGDKEEARRLLDRALPLARWSVIAKHLLQRIYGTMILAAPDAQAARALVDQAEATLGETDSCSFCVVMLAVPVGHRVRRGRGPRRGTSVRRPSPSSPPAGGPARPGRPRRRRPGPTSPGPRGTWPRPSGCCPRPRRGSGAAGQPGDAARCDACDRRAAACWSSNERSETLTPGARVRRTVRLGERPQLAALQVAVAGRPAGSGRRRR